MVSCGAVRNRRIVILVESHGLVSDSLCILRLFNFGGLHGA